MADWNPGEQRLTVYHGTQAPHMMQNLFAKHLGLEEHQVRVITKDVGGSFGIKVHTYADEMATVGAVEAAQAAGQVRRRPAGELRHRHPCARPPRQGEGSASSSDGTITAWEIDDLTGIGPYSVYPRTSGIEANQIVNLIGGPYTLPELPGARARRVPEQERDVPVPRGRPPDRDRGDRGPGRARGGEDRHGPGGDPAAQPHPPTTPIRHRGRPASSSRSSRITLRSTRSCAMMDYAGAARRAGRGCASAASIAASASPPSSR